MSFKSTSICFLIPLVIILLAGCSYQKNKDMLHFVVGENEFVIVEAEYNSNFASMETFEITCSIKNKTKNSFYINHGANFIRCSANDEDTETIAIGEKERISGGGIISKTIDLQTSDIIDNKVTIIVEFDVVKEDEVQNSVKFTKDIVFD